MCNVLPTQSYGYESFGLVADISADCRDFYYENNAHKDSWWHLDNVDKVQNIDDIYQS